ncbi:MAG: class I SAM-dependent methyltransferase [Gemmataceae bacterium]
MTMTTDRPVTASPGRAVPPRRGSYGIDAPYAVALMSAVLALQVGLALVNPNVLKVLAVLIVATVLGCYLYATLRGKFVAWAEILKGLNLRGDERILDLGCGRGAVLLLAAQHLTSGRAAGVDVWRTLDQSGNRAEATRRNAAAEGVADRVDLYTADMTALPFEDDSFDVIVSNLAVHNISRYAGRQKAIDEAVRVLRPGGRLLIIDILGTRQYEVRLGEVGMTDVTRRRLGWRSWWVGPYAVAYLVTATKPGRRAGGGRQEASDGVLSGEETGR